MREKARKKGLRFVKKARLAVLGLAVSTGLAGSLAVLSCGLTTVLVAAAPSAVLTRAPRLCTRASSALRERLESVSAMRKNRLHPRYLKLSI